MPPGKGSSRPSSEVGDIFNSAVSDRIGQSTAQNFERLRSDLKILKRDVHDLDSCMTSFMREKRHCLDSDCRRFYRSVILDNDIESETEDISAPLSPTESSASEAALAKSDSLEDSDGGYFSSYSISNSLDVDEENDRPLEMGFGQNMDGLGRPSSLLYRRHRPEKNERTDSVSSV